MDRNGATLRPVARCGISDVETSGSAVTVLVSYKAESVEVNDHCLVKITVTYLYCTSNMTI